MPLKKKKGKKKKKVSEEARLRKKLDKWDTKAMKRLTDLDMYWDLLRKWKPWIENHKSLVSEYFFAIPCPFDERKLDDFISSIRPLDEIDESLDKLISKFGDVNPSQSSNAIYSTIVPFGNGLKDLGAPYTEMDIHIICRLVQYYTAAENKQEQESNESVSEEPEKSGTISKTSEKETLSTSVASSKVPEKEIPETLESNPELFQDLIVNVSRILFAIDEEFQYVWDLIHSNESPQRKTKERIPWIKDILTRRKAAEALKKKKKKKKRPKSGKKEFPRCKLCGLVITDPYSGPTKSEMGYIVLSCKYRRRGRLSSHPLDMEIKALSHWPVAQVERLILEQSGLATSTILLYDSEAIDDKTSLAIPSDITFFELMGETMGGPEWNPLVLELFYDYVDSSSSATCPLLNSESFYDYADYRIYKNYTINSLQHQSEYAKNYIKIQKEGHKCIAHSESEGDSDSDEDDENESD